MERIRVCVYVFAHLKPIVGSDRIELEMPPEAQVSDLLKQLTNLFPDLQEWLSTTFVALNQEYVSLHSPLHNGDEVALIPPVSGG